MQAVLKTNLATAVLEQQPALRDYIAGVDWLLQDATRLRYISPGHQAIEARDGVDTEELRERLREARTIAVLASTRPIGQRFLAIGSLLHASHTLKSTRSLTRTLYGSFFEPGRPRPEYLEGAGTRHADELSLDFRAAQTKAALVRLLAEETDERRKLDLFLWATLHIHGHLHGSFDELSSTRLSVSAELLDELWANEMNRDLFTALGLARDTSS
jgi:hypothetical protein